jgi:ATP-dependent DNA helicase RecG
MSNRLDLKPILSKGESLSVEFKSDQKCLSDRDLVSAVVSLANTEGGDLFLGVEDDGTVTGLHPKHMNINGLTSMIAGKTNPPLCVTVATHVVGQNLLAQISVPKSKQLVSTSEGLLQRRRLMANGKPQAVPFYPHEFSSRLSSLGVIDPSALPVLSLTLDDLNPLERQRLREAIRRYGGDASLLPLADDELDGALGLFVTVEGVRRPTLAGLLVLGSEQDIRIHFPTHEVAFQVLEGTEVRINEFFRKPLLQTFEEIERLFNARLNEREIQVGLFRVPIPNFDKRAFREAFVNSLVHRDYSSLGAVHVRFDDNGLTISNPCMESSWKV